MSSWGKVASVLELDVRRLRYIAFQNEHWWHFLKACVNCQYFCFQMHVKELWEHCVSFCLKLIEAAVSSFTPLFTSIDHLTIPSRCGKGLLHRVSEVFDCWFESGSMPYAQIHYPFENKREFEDAFPADFIAEGIDQTRGWYVPCSLKWFIDLI